MSSDKARTNRKWTSTKKYRNNFDDTFGSGAAEGVEEEKEDAEEEEEEDRLRSFDYHCLKCDRYFIKVVYLSERNKKNLPCDYCGTPGIERIFGAPAVLTASFPDGLRKKSESWRNMSEASKLNVEAAQEGRHTEKERIKKEVKNLIGKQIDKGI